MMMFYRLRQYGLWVLGAFFCFPLFIYAASDTNTFSVRQLVGDDFAPPTTPAFITAVPVASTQIDVSWGTSTDDFAFGGYRLYRDTVHIATTSLTSYSDTGLTPSTTYSYTVEAYDQTMKISTSTGPVATTTLQAVTPPATTTPPSSGGGGRQVKLNELSIDTTTDSAVFSWETNVYTRYVLRWGLSSSYELGFVQSDVYKKDHFTRVDGLSPGTEYQYELVGYDRQDREYVLRRDVFRTTDLPDETAPANVSHLRATVSADTVYLSWKNPSETDFAKVRIVRNYFFYPLRPTDGFIVYEGSNESVLDADALQEYERQYYTVYTYDTLGNISSGAVVQAVRDGVVILEPDVPDVEGQEDDDRGGSGGGGSSDDSDDDTASTTDPVITETISFSDVIFIQDGFVLNHGSNNVVVRDDLPVTIQLAADLLPKYAKAVTVTLRDGSDIPQSYILRANKARTMYETRITTLPEGTYFALFAIYNFAQNAETVFRGEIISAPYTNVLTQERESVIVNLVKNEKIVTYGAFPGLLFLLFIMWWYLFVLRRTLEDN